MHIGAWFVPRYGKTSDEDSYDLSLSAIQHAKDEMAAGQFLLSMGNYEFNVQVAAHGHRRVEDIFQPAR